MKSFFVLYFCVSQWFAVMAIAPEEAYLVVGDRKGDVKLNERLAGIGDTVFPKDIITIGSKPGSSIWLYSPSGKNKQLADKGIYEFSRLMDSIQSLAYLPWYAKLWSFVVRKATEHHVVERADNTIGGTEKSVTYFSPSDYHLLLEDTLHFEWRKLGYASKARFILADTVLFNSEGLAVYMNQVIDTNISTTSFDIDFKSLQLRSSYVYYWCVNYEGGQKYRFHPFYYVNQQQREDVKEILQELDKKYSGSNSPERLKEVFVKSFF